MGTGEIRGGMEGESTERDDWNEGGHCRGGCGNLLQWKLHEIYEVDPREDS